MVVHVNKKIVTQTYLYEYLLSYGVQKYVSGSVQKQLTRENLSVMPVIIPPLDLLTKFDSLTAPIIKAIEINTNETNKLVSLRDWLLPILMNGQATITD